MIITQQTIEECGDIQTLIETAMDYAKQGKCVELYFSSWKYDVLVYFDSDVYGLEDKYEWTYTSYQIRKIGDDVCISFTNDCYDYLETREFCLSGLYKIYIGDTWSN